MKKKEIETVILGSEKERFDADKKIGKPFSLKRLPVFIIIETAKLPTNDSRMIPRKPPNRQALRATKPKTLQHGGVL